MLFILDSQVQFVDYWQPILITGHKTDRNSLTFHDLTLT